MITGIDTSGGPVVGVALPVPEPWGTQIQSSRLGYGEHRAGVIPTHITLLPPTPVEPQQIDRLQEHLAEVAAAHQRFDVILRGSGTFRPVSDVVYLQVAQGVSACERLEQAVRNGPVHRKLSFPYHPHVTLAHDLPQDALDAAFEDYSSFTASYVADEFCLYRHNGDEVWEVAETFSLRT